MTGKNLEPGLCGHWLVITATRSSNTSLLLSAFQNVFDVF